MARLRDGRLASVGVVFEHVHLELLIGPAGPGDVERLRLAWELYADRVSQGLPGTRPWAFWRFDVGEEPPRGDDGSGLGWWGPETVRLAELGLLTGEELAGFEEAANEARLRIGTDRELISGGWREHGVSLDVQAVRLWDAIRERRRFRDEREEQP